MRYASSRKPFSERTIPLDPAFRQGLVDAGYAEGHDVVIEWRSANGDNARVPELAADLVHRNVELIVVESTVAAQSLKPPRPPPQLS